MSKHNKVRLAAGFILAALFVAGTAADVSYAQQQGPQREERKGAGMMMRGGPGRALRLGLRQLGLSDTQKQQVKAILQGHKADFKGFADRLVTARRTLGDAIAVDPINEAAIREKSADLAKVQADLAVFRAQVRKEVFGVLTPDQQQKAKDMKARFLDRVDRFRANRHRKMGESF
ncbi:MAG TPA: Spy/CpxP family protein refolding chaperone [Vicinamibacterales bacterium]